jgi:hypothetical protein
MMLQDFTPEVLDFSDIHKQSWDLHLDEYPESTVFHTREWMMALQEGFGWKPGFLAAINWEHGSFLSAIPFMIDRRYGIENYFSMPFDTYGGAIGDPWTFPSLYTTFADLPGIGMRYYVDFRRQDHRGEEWGFKRRTESTEFLDISRSLDDIWKTMSARNRRVINSNGGGKIQCRIAETTEDLKSFKDLIAPSEDIHGGGVPQQLMNGIILHMIPEKCLPYLTEVDEIPVCASLFFIHGNMATYWAMSLGTFGRATHAHYQTMWKVIYDLKVNHREIKYLNLGATPQETTTVLPWKRSWGTQRSLYYVYTKIPLLLRPILAVKEAFS